MWKNIPADLFEKLNASLPKRAEAVRKAKIEHLILKKCILCLVLGAFVSFYIDKIYLMWINENDLPLNGAVRQN